MAGFPVTPARRSRADRSVGTLIKRVTAMLQAQAEPWSLAFDQCRMLYPLRFDMAFVGVIRHMSR